LNFRGFIVIIYVIALLITIASVLSLSPSEWQSLSLGQTLAFGFSLLIGFCGVLIAYFVYLDGKILSALQGKSHHEERKESKQLSGTNELTFTMAHVKVDQLERHQYGELKRRAVSNKKSVVKEIVSESQTLVEHEYLEITSASDVSAEIKEKLAKKLGTDFQVSQGSSSGKGSVLYVERVIF
jgi:hypothetical protein